MVQKVSTGFLERNGVHFLLEGLHVPLPGEGVHIVDQAITSIDGDPLTDQQIGWAVKFFLAERHAGAVGQDGGLGELLSLQEHRERGFTVILLIDFLNLNGTISQEEVQDIKLITTIIGAIRPYNVKR